MPPRPACATRLLLREHNGVLLPAGPSAGQEGITAPARTGGTPPSCFFPAPNNPGFYDRILVAFACAPGPPRGSPRRSGRGPTASDWCAQVWGDVHDSRRRRASCRPTWLFRALRGPVTGELVGAGLAANSAPDPALAAFLAIADEPGGRTGEQQVAPDGAIYLTPLLQAILQRVEFLVELLPGLNVQDLPGAIHRLDRPGWSCSPVPEICSAKMDDDLCLQEIDLFAAPEIIQHGIIGTNPVLPPPPLKTALQHVS